MEPRPGPDCGSRLTTLDHQGSTTTASRCCPFTAIADVVRDKFGLAQMVMVGDRGMITSARIAALNQAGDGTQRPEADAYGWITALRAPAIRKLMADGGPLQLSLSGQQDLAEITSPDYPGERLIACRNPVLAADRARTCDDLLAATEKLLAPLLARVEAGRLTGAGPIGVEVGKVISTYKTAKHFTVTIADTTLTVERRQDQIDAEAALDGFYVLRTPVPACELDAPAVVAAYKNLKYVERDSGTSNLTTWTCGRFSTGSRNASRPTC
jgi:hypothetical protein